jgi:hypothetical protein
MGLTGGPFRGSRLLLCENLPPCRKTLEIFEEKFVNLLQLIPASAAIALSLSAIPASSVENRSPANTLIASNAAGAMIPAASPAGPVLNPGPADSIELNRPPLVEDACRKREVAANATRPAWDYAASTTQCGVLEGDFGFLSQPMGGGVSQQMLVSSMRYGLTPKLDLRWGLTNHIFQGGGDSPSVQGSGDQWLGARYRFVEQGRVVPAMALLYTGKIPSANPAKGLGSGFVDHQMVFIASRDLGKSHFDFNTLGTLAGSAQGFDGAAQFGLAVTRPITSKLSGILESYGGPQPGTADRFGAGFLGATYALRPQLVFDTAYTRTYTAGSPRQQVLFGFTYARRSGFAPLPRSAAFARFLGR